MGLSRVAPVQIQAYQSKEKEEKNDLLAVEEPMEIQLVHGERANRIKQSLTITMRTPGHDLELTLGFLLSEGIITDRAQVREIRHCIQVEHPEAEGNVVRVELSESVELVEERLQRNFVASASCGVCGKASLEGIETIGCPVLPAGPVWNASLIHSLSDKLSDFQTIFSHTGGLHAAALVDLNGKLLHVREDIGRHNALDKLIGAAVEEEALPLSECLIFLSGRIGFELVQKALMAGSPVLAAVGAPSSLAVRLAKQYGMSLLGFVRNQRFNVYSGSERIRA
ncbi:MAG: formate dehydrogenase accessory sulfurtransferase FdhD [Bacteroidota bacterium]